MPFPKPFALVTWGGYFNQADNQDDWSVTLKFTVPNGAPDFGRMVSNGGARLVFETVGEFWGNPDLGIRQNAYLKWAKVNSVGPDGRYVDRTKTNYYEWENEKAGSLTTTHPYQIAACATLLTQNARGLASRGRMFLPTGLPFVAANGGMTPQATEAMANCLANLIDALNNMFRSTGNAVACVVSDTREGAVHQITGVSVGHRFDVQRRRDNAERETYGVSHAINPPAPGEGDDGRVIALPLVPGVTAP